MECRDCKSPDMSPRYPELCRECDVDYAIRFSGVEGVERVVRLNGFDLEVFRAEGAKLQDAVAEG